MEVCLRQSLQVAIEAAHAAGQAILPLYGRAPQLSQPGHTGPVTAADLAANACIQEIVSQAFPDDGWLSEETVDRAERLQKVRVWIVDPLDGTSEFISGVPEFVVSIGLCIAGVATLGVLYNPVTEETFSGIRGEGAWLNGTPIRVSHTTDIGASTFCVSRSESQKALLRRLEGHLHLQPMGSVAYKCGMVAAGRHEGVFTHHPRNEWDICAGVAILEAAGGRVTNRQGDAYRFNRPNPLKTPIVGTNAHIHAALLALLNALT